MLDLLKTLQDSSVDGLLYTLILKLRSFCCEERKDKALGHLEPEDCFSDLAVYAVDCNIVSLRQDKMVIFWAGVWYLPGEPQPIVARAPPSQVSMLKVPRSSNQLPSQVIALQLSFC